jgi:hypothetical protein
LYERLSDSRRPGAVCTARGGRPANRHAETCAFSHTNRHADTHTFGHTILHAQPYRAITFGDSDQCRAVAYADGHRIHHTHNGRADQRPKLDAAHGHAYRHQHVPAAHADGSAQRDANAHTQTFGHLVGYIAAFGDAAADSHVSTTDPDISTADWAIAIADAMTRLSATWCIWNTLSCVYDCST